MLREIVSFLLHHLVFALMLSIGLVVRWRDLIEVLRQPVFYLRSLAVMEVGVPLLAMGVVALFPISQKASILILLMAVCPGAPFIPSGAKHEGETHSVVGLNLLVMVSLLAPLTIPAWIWILDRVFLLELEVAPLDVLTIVARNVIGPLLLGLVIQRFSLAAALIGRAAHHFFVVAFAVAIAGVVYLGAPALLEVAPIAFAAVLIMTLGSAFLGYWAATPRPEERRATAIAAALGNPGLALAVVAASFPGFRAAALMAAYLIFRKLVLIVFEQYIERRKSLVITSPRPS